MMQTAFEIMIFVLTLGKWLMVIFALGAVLLICGLIRILLHDEIESRRERQRVLRRAAREARRVAREKERLRIEKENAAFENYFTITFHKGFDSNGAVIARFAPKISPEAQQWLKDMDALADDKLFDTTQEIRDELR